ncbi:hypothetical protein FPZ12_028820 [Amycolatopsis acidicola]|uniref:Guanylate cyclase domain-containing protein n=1 Tax=Amycolatopsis acidicola TaxID=2596893 RepID=A0A5N0UU26_9PSEU|nr:hypothetical protein [Amycolatopsis acidicola]KAA9155925.1 hypothetical protein FPZ12_028820 [Amycolatopsis acidicola]
MNLLPETRTLLGIDVVASATNPGYHLDALSRALSEIMETALSESGIHPEEILEKEHTGDGALYTFPSRDLGRVLDLSHRLDELATKHNRWRKPETRLRLAVDVGAVGDSAGYYSPKIWRGRLLNSRAFKGIVEKCLEERPDGSVSSGLIVSATAFREAFGGDYTKLVRQADFAEIQVDEKEYHQPAWVRVPGFDARSLKEFAGAAPEPEEAGTVRNVVNGSMRNSIQVGGIRGDVHLGTSPS